VFDLGASIASVPSSAGATGIGTAKESAATSLVLKAVSTTALVLDIEAVTGPVALGARTDWDLDLVRK